MFCERRYSSNFGDVLHNLGSYQVLYQNIYMSLHGQSANYLYVPNDLLVFFGLRFQTKGNIFSFGNI